MIKRWNEKTREYEAFEPGTRRYPDFPAELRPQLMQVTPSMAGRVLYFPCDMTLRNGAKVDRAVLVDAPSYIAQWGVWPDQDAMKREVLIQDVLRIEDSVFRLPVKLANKLHEAGESGMGYQIFEIGYRSGLRSAHLAGNLVDFIELPAGRKMSEVVDVYPHEGRDRKPLIHGPDYSWCLVASL